MKIFRNLYWLINPFLIVIFMLLLDNLFNIKEMWINAIIAVPLAYALSPRVRIVERQNEEEEQIKWIFLKKVINKKI